MRISEIITELSQAERKARAGVHSDQFFTRPAVAQDFAHWVKSQPWFSSVTRMIEPAAGSQDLSRHFPGIEEYDLEPKAASIRAQDFLASQHERQGTTLVIMNPPYGQRSDLAIRFFNKAATFADYIAQIVPRTFKSSSIQHRLDKNWSLVAQYVLPPGSFYLPGEGPDRRYDVPAVAQIWQREDAPRTRDDQAKLPDSIRFVSADQADFAFRRKGRRAGQIVTTDIELTNPNSFVYIKTTPEMLRKFQSVDWSQYGHDVLGARSISRAEMAQALA